MIGRLTAILLGTAAPLALTAQEVTLRSPDEFISVDGEIIGYNGVMLRVRTLVGEVSVPASEVICYGDGCLEVLANNDFGLTEDALVDVVATPVVAEQEAAPPVPQAPQAPVENDLTIAFTSPATTAFFSSFAAARPDVTVNGTTLSLADGATLANVSDPSSADIAVQSVGFDGTRAAVFSGPAGWTGDGGALTHQMIALSAFAVQISPSAGLDSITITDLARVFAGEVTNWSQIGGANVPVLGLRLPDTAPTYQELLSVLMSPSGREMSSAVLAMGDEAGITASVNQFPGSIAVVSAAAANPALTIPVAGSCGIAVTPTAFNIISGDYPLIRPAMASYGTTAPDSVIELFDAAATDAAQTVAPSLGLLDYSASAQDVAIKNARLNQLLSASFDQAQRAAAAAMFQTLLPAQRLSTTFFGGAVSGPEAGWNRAMMIDLAEALAAPENAGREVIFVGIGASEAGSQQAISLSAQAASAMQAAFADFAADTVSDAGLTLSSYGFGDVSLTTCVDSQVSPAEGTRVEVWLR